MNELKPYSYLYRKTSSPKILKSCFVVRVPAGKKITGPNISVDGSETTIQYNIEHDTTQQVPRQEEYNNEMSWDGRERKVRVHIGEGDGTNTTLLDSADAEEL